MKRSLIVAVFLLLSWFMIGVGSVQAAGFQHELRPVQLVAGEELVVPAPFAFQVFALKDVEGIQVRFHDRKGWGEWRDLGYEEPGLNGSSLIFVETSDSLALRSQRTIQTEITLMNVGDGGVEMASLGPVAFATPSGGTLNIISRAQWGADESIGTYDPRAVEDSGDEGSSVNSCAPLEKAFPGQYQLQDRVDYFDALGRNLVWPRTYSTNVKKIVIHHTAQDIRDLDGDGVVNETDYRLGVKAIHTFHTLTRGWGDIGYHYLVDPAGNIYEGRAGGKDVIAAHVLCQNSNTVGVAVMGNFEEERVEKAAFDGLVKIVSYLTELYQINPLGKSVFRGTELPHIVSHGEVGAVTKSYIGTGATSCPGTNLVKLMSRLRTEVANGGSLVADYAYALLDSSPTLTVKPLEKFELSVTLKNAGQQSWREVNFVTRGRDPVEVTVSPVFVGPGDELEIKIPMQAGLDAGRERLTFDVTINGQRQSRRIPLEYSVRLPVYSYDLLSFEGSTDPLLIGQKRDLTLKLKNTSNFTWYKDGDYQLKIQQVDIVRGRTILTRQGLSLELSKDVQEGDVVVVPIELPAQTRRGDFELTLIPMIGRDRGLEGAPISLNIPVEMPNFVADVYPADLRQRLTRGFEESVELAVVNNGNYAWDTGTVWVEIGDDRQLIPIGVGIGERYVFLMPLRAGYEDQVMTVTGRVGIDQAPSFLDARRFRKDQQSFTVDIRATGAVRLSGEYVRQSHDEIPAEKEVYDEWVEIKNTSSVPWYNSGRDQIVLQGPLRGNFRHRSWKRGVQAGFLTQEIVMPGEVGRFELQLQVRRTSRYAMIDDFQLMVGDQPVRTTGGAIRFATPGVQRRQSEEATQEPVSSGESVTASIPPMRVWLTDVTQDEVQISSPGAFIVWDSQTVQVQNQAANAVVTIRKEDLSNGKVYRLRAVDAPYLQFRNWDRLQSFGVGINDNTFRGVLEFRLVDGQLTAINELALEDYMKGIAEVPESDDQPQDKRKVIAVLARSYALHYLIGGYEKFPGKPFNAADSPAIFQKYLGYNFEQRSPQWQQAIADTADEVVMVNTNVVQGLSDAERVLRAAYFSCTDGSATKSGVEVWPDNSYFQIFSAVFQSVLDPLGDDPTREGMAACGHQVGLSGYGATQKAKAGQSYRQIIESYYQGVTVEPYQS